MKSLIKDKKGDGFQLVFLLVILFIMAVVGLLFLTLSNEITDAYKDSGLLNNTAIGQQANQTLHDTAPRTTDYMIFFMFLGGTVGIISTAVRTNFSPTMMFLFILLLIITIFVASGLVNIYSGFASAAVMVNENNELVLTGFIFSKYTPLIFAVIGGIIMLVMWGKSGGDIIT